MALYSDMFKIIILIKYIYQSRSLMVILQHKII